MRQRCKTLHTLAGFSLRNKTNIIFINRLQGCAAFFHGVLIALYQSARQRPRVPMTHKKLSRTLAMVVALITVLVFCPTVFAQGPLPDAANAAVEPVQPIVIAPQSETGTHRFWDTQNCLLFAASAALSGADFAVTRSNLQAGGTEMNPIVRIFGNSTTGLAVNFAGETAGVVTLGYFFHRTGHHRLERAISIVNIGASTGAVAYGTTHRGVRVTARF
jgi:hypothetical protein